MDSQEPVAWMHVQGRYEEPNLHELADEFIERGWTQYPLYAAPPDSVPLSEYKKLSQLCTNQGIRLMECEGAPVVDKRVKVKLGRQYGYKLNQHWFYLQPADEYAEQALTKHSGISVPPKREWQALVQPEQEPMFWYRPLENGFYAGPIHNNSVVGKMLRDENPEEWIPLYTSSISEPVKERISEPVENLASISRCKLCGGALPVTHALVRTGECDCLAQTDQ